MLARRTALRPLPALRRMVSAGEPLDPETIAAFREATGLEPADGYGQTETGQVTANLVGEPVRPGSMGKPLPGIETRIVEGELQLRAASSPTFFSRYLDGERFEGEWWPTGDLVREDEDGYLFFEGRGDDIILSSGYRIGPTEVESALLSHPAVAEAAAVAAPDPERGSVVRAIVVLRDGRAQRQRRARPRAAGALQTRDRPLQVPPHRRVRRRAAEDQQRQDQAGAAARRSRVALGGEQLGGVDRPAQVVALGHVDAVGRSIVRVSSSSTNSAIVRLPSPRAISTIAFTVSWSASLRGMSRMKVPSILITSKGIFFR